MNELEELRAWCDTHAKVGSKQARVTLGLIVLFDEMELWMKSACEVGYEENGTLWDDGDKLIERIKAIKDKVS